MCSSGNIIALGFFLSSSSVAQYSIAYSVICILQNFITPLADSLYPYMIKNRNYVLVKKILYLVEPLILVACIVGGAVAEPVITLLFGNEYEVAAKVFRVMLPIVIATLPGCLLGFPTLSALGLYREVNLSNLVSAVFHILGFVILCILGRISIYTVAILTCCTEWLLVSIRFCLIMRERRKRGIVGWDGKR